MEEVVVPDSTTILTSYTPTETSFEIPIPLDLDDLEPEDPNTLYKSHKSLPETLSPTPSTRSQKVFHKDIAPLISNAGVRGMVTNVSHGTYRDVPASLIVFMFSLRSGGHGFRFKNANIKITFSKHLTSTDSGSPSVVMLAPRKIYGLPTLEGKKNRIGGEFSLEVPVGSINIGPRLRVERESKFETEHRFETVGNFWSSTAESKWDVVYWDMRENRRTKGGLPDRLNVAVVVESEGPFLGIAEVTIDTPVANGAFSHPWTKNNPAIFVPGIPMGPQPRTDKFDELTEAEWLRLIPFQDEWETKFTESSLGEKMPIPEGKSPLLSAAAVSERAVEVDVELLEEEESDDR